MTFFTKYDPAPCDKKCHSKHQTLFPLFEEGLGTRLVTDSWHGVLEQGLHGDCIRILVLT